MNAPNCLVVEREEDWVVMVGTQTEVLASDVPAEEIATCVKTMCELSRLKSPPCILAPSSNSCFFTILEADDEVDIRDRAALAYQLEDHLPIDAEAMAADFVALPPPRLDVNSVKTEIAAVGIEVERWRAIADAFEMSGFPVRCIVPSAVLISRSICRDLNFADTVDILCVDSDRCDLVTIQSETLIGWKRTTCDENSLRRHRLLDVENPDRVIVVGADDAAREMIQQTFLDAEFHSDPVETHLRAGADLYLASPSPRWFDLRRDRLGASDPLRPVQSELRLATVAAVVCLLAIVIGGSWRTIRIENAISRVHSQQEEMFEKAFPGVKVPAALMRRVRSEHTRVMGSRGVASEVEVPQSATDVLRELLAALPADVRFRIESLSILNGRVDLDLQVRSPVDAGTLASSLSSSGFDVKPPVTTQKDAKTFESTLEAVWSGNATRSATTDDVTLHITIRREVKG